MPYRKCSLCGKEFLLPPETIYRLTIKGKRCVYCSYTCYIKVKKELEIQRRRK